MIRLTALCCVVVAASLNLAAAASPQPPNKQASKTPAPTLKLAPGQAAVYVDNMHCAGCARKIARKIYGVKGVVRVEMNVKANRAVITPQAKKQVSSIAIWSAVQKAGFRPVKLIGPEGTYAPHAKTGAPQLTPKQARQQPSPAPR